MSFGVRELESDLKWLQRDAVRLIDKLVLTQAAIQRTRWRLLQIRKAYVLPDGRTK